MLKITDQLSIHDDEIELSPIRAQGAGGQNVNKVSSAIHLRFDIAASSLPAAVKQRLLARRDRRITAEGVLIIKAQNHRSQEKNRADAIRRLAEMIRKAQRAPRRRIPTHPGKAVRERRLAAKKKRSELKKLRGKPDD